MVVILGILYCFCLSFYTLTTSSQPRKQRHTPKLTSLNYSFAIIFPSQRYRTPLSRKFNVPSSQYTLAGEAEHDFGGLELRFPEYHTSQDNARIIYRDNYENTEYEELWNDADDDGSMESYYAFDDDDKRNPFVMYDDPDIHLRKKCRRTSWHRQLPITCNTMHEFDFHSHVTTGDAKYLGYVHSVIYS
jgi:hypothetical protein